MQRWRGLEAIPAGWGRCVATIGVFDGVHRGHQHIITRLREVAAARSLPTVLITFTPHPSEVVRPGSHPPILTTNTRKAELAAELGIDVVMFVPFTHELSKLSPAEFVHEALVLDLHASAVVVGQNFRFGHKASGSVDTLAELGERWGFDAEGVPVFGTDHPISSTYIRSCVEAGDVAAAEAALGRPHRLDGVVIRGDQRGRDLGFPTANLRAEQYAAVPADGIYAGRVVRIDEWGNTVPTSPGDKPRIAAISVGSNPTFDGRHRSVEAYILDFDGDLYGQNLGVEFEHRLRGMERYDSIGDLVSQMAVDVEQTRELLG
ncbi:MAG TPA: bifunctional riboflavin kinase/FAD synthetase [Jatrophihabitans sp.]|jgi:riboflavin kinase/FMN adenylyltransferase